MSPERERARVFLALPLGAELGEALVAAARAALGDERAARDFRWARPEGLHLTLLFFGDVERSLVADVWSEVASRCGGMEAPRLAIEATGSFPGARGRERVLWWGVEPADSPELAALREGCLAGAERAGFSTADERARPFRPHVTLARPRAARPRVAEAFYALRSGAPWVPGELVLLESVPAPGGARYAALETLPLARGERG